MKRNIKKTAVAFFAAAAVFAMGSVSTLAGQREAFHRPQREHCGGHHRQEKAGRKHGCRF